MFISLSNYTLHKILNSILIHQKKKNNSLINTSENTIKILREEIFDLVSWRTTIHGMHEHENEIKFNTINIPYQENMH